MNKAHQTIRCIYCGGNFKLFTSENKEQVKKLRDYLLVQTAENHYIDITTPKAFIHKNSDLMYGICPSCCNYILGDALSQMIDTQREILFRKFK